MLIDATLMLSDKQAITTSAASENIIDQATAGNACAHAMVVAHADEDFAGAEEISISLQTSEQADFGVYEQLASVSCQAQNLKAGKTLLKMALPLGVKRYIRGYYQVTGTATAGKLSLFVTAGADR